MSVTPITNHVQQALQRLLQQYKGRPLIAGFYTAFVQQIQDLENSGNLIEPGLQIWDGTTTPSVGAQLDLIGRIVGISRNGLDDAQYILVIFGKIAENFSDDTIQSVLAVVGYLFQAQEILVQEIFPAGLYIQVLEPAIPSNFFPLVVNLIQNAMGGGIKLVIGSSPTVNTFRFSGPGVTSANGFGTVSDPDSGGIFAGLIT